MPTDTEIAWAAGLFEGEGCISILRNKSGPSVRLYLNMTDGDIVERFRDIVGGKMYGPIPPKKAHHKPMYRWTSSGDEHARKILQLLKPYLGKRRTARMIDVLMWDQDRNM